MKYLPNTLNYSTHPKKEAQSIQQLQSKSVFVRAGGNNTTSSGQNKYQVAVIPTAGLGSKIVQ